MKPLEKDEVFQNLSEFLQSKGIELKDGTYAAGIQKSCSLLSEAINAGQEGLGRAKAQFDKTVDQMRQVIHEKTAPKASPPPQKPEPGTPPTAAASTPPATESAGPTVAENPPSNSRPTKPRAKKKAGRAKSTRK